MLDQVGDPGDRFSHVTAQIRSNTIGSELFLIELGVRGSGFLDTCPHHVESLCKAFKLFRVWLTPRMWWLST